LPSRTVTIRLFVIFRLSRSGKEEALLVATTCSKAPTGRALDTGTLGL
jgi:hypothetical protein